VAAACLALVDSARREVEKSVRIRAALLDLDGTLVAADMLDVVTTALGRDVSQVARRPVGPPDGGELVDRVNLLLGATVQQLQRCLASDARLRTGAMELMQFLRERHIVSILVSGNILPVLDFYRELLGIDHVIGMRPAMDGSTILGIPASEAPDAHFKLTGAKRLLRKLGIASDEVVAIGDSPTDAELFQFSALSIAVAPKGGVERLSTWAVRDDLREVLPYLRSWLYAASPGPAT
jgi:HAD superfamily phosphoserine phosphatase-like hydrolase